MPRRELVPVPDSRRLALTVTGPPTPVAIVLEAGLGASAATWGPVQRLTSRCVRTVSYDRAGYGRSEPADDARGLPELARDLAHVVDATSAERVVLVGHSWGAAVVRTYARDAGARLHGVVLVDPAEEEADLYLGQVPSLGPHLQSDRLAAVVHGALFLRSAFSVLAHLPRPYLGPAVVGTLAPRSLRAMFAERRQVIAGLRELGEGDDVPDGVPLRVLSAQVPSRVERGLRSGLVAEHRRRAAAAGGVFVPAHRSGHMIPVAEPELVAEHAVALCRD